MMSGGNTSSAPIRDKDENMGYAATAAYPVFSWESLGLLLQSAEEYDSILYGFKKTAYAIGKSFLKRRTL